ncbi:MAG: transglutaminase-like domain-containing protein [Natronincolaceae bacterium]
MSKMKFIFFSLVMLMLLSPAKAFAAISNIDKGQLENGIITTTYVPKKNVASKIMIAKGDVKYTYDIKDDDCYPLQLGNGKYIVSILDNVEGNKYKRIETKEIELKLADNNRVFLQSNQIINWDHSMEAIKKARELTEGIESDEEKITEIYNFIINNISYDKDKTKNLQAGYLPSIDCILEDKKGICYDYSVLFAAMLRSLDIPAKLIMGREKNNKNVYHAWNQVYLKDIDEWVTIDTTYDAAFKNMDTVMIKDTELYIVEKQY